MSTIYLPSGQISCLIYKDSDWIPGLNFVTPDDMFVQVGSWWYDSGKELQKHCHKIYERVACLTQEAIYIKSGSLKVSLYTEDKIFFKDFILSEGDLAVFAFGGHGYTIMSDNTKVIEIKNGPFVDVQTDKEKF